MGLYFSQERWVDLDRNIARAARYWGFSTTEEFVARLLSSSLEHDPIESLADFLTISESYFWREAAVFDALRTQILPPLIRSRERGFRHLRIWCAGCSTGEEPYSIAILLRMLIPDLSAWRITILATDINPRVLSHAAAGIYRPWSFRNVSPTFQETYFRPTPSGTFELLPEIRQMVTFAPLNLAEDIYPSLITNTTGMDMILCRNVLMYFSREIAQRVGQRFRKSLINQGWLLVGASELSHTTFDQFESVSFTDAIVYRRVDEVKTLDSLVSPVRSKKPFVPRRPPGPQIGQRAQADSFQLSDELPASQPDSQPDILPVALPVALPADLSARRSLLPTPVHTVGETLPPVVADQAMLARTLANEGQLVEAWAACERALVDNKLDPGLHYLSALILREQNLAQEAMYALRRVLFLSPTFVMAHFTLGNLVQATGDWVAARRSYQNVLDLLATLGPEDELPEADGVSVGRLRAIVQANLRTIP